MPQTYEYWDDSQNMFQPQGQAQPGSNQANVDRPQQPPRTQQSTQRFQQPQQQVPQQQAAQQPQQQAQAQANQQRYQAPAAAAPAYQQAAQIAYVPVEQKKSRGWIVAVVMIVCLFAFTAFCVKTCSDAVVGSGAYTVSAGPSSDSVAVVDLSGTIQYDGTACSPEGLKALLDQAEDDDHIKAVVLRVNSGGGTATAGEEMATYVRDFSKPVVISSASINASAAYEISSQADYIYVAKSTEIGAIGTAMQVTDLSGLMDMLGVDVDVITSADSKDSSYGYRALTEEERAYYQKMIDQINNVFIENVSIGRSMPIERVRELATGLSFTGIDAVQNGLADEVGTLENALDKAAELAGVSDYSKYNLSLSSYDLSGLYYLLGGQQTDEQKALPILKQ